ncbi:energy transducer TonB family protein [Paracoccus sulfuroxidans]|uniref:TonB family protein n=1 Tax=Paracoccus sulfuroxidans TaxID=384678 RepID=A0A562N7V7_9RHOB|nr:energy transducer TonB [Paracoccus sulfuroxidans]TWI28180.1 TonB family protein [Paracoccus sulfuroxidans]
MLRTIFLSLCLSLPVLLPAASFAQQKSWSGTAEPRNEKEWIRAVQLRVNANAVNSFMTNRLAGTGRAKGVAALTVEIASDGQIKAVSIRTSSGSEEVDESLRRGVMALPQMPRFTPDMQGDSIALVIPFALHG